MVFTQTARIETRGDCDVVDITGEVSKAVTASGMGSGAVTVFVAHSTCAITTVEYEPGLVADLKAAFERIAPAEGLTYHHNQRWGDGNGHSHVRASLLGCSRSIPFVDKRLILGTWQQVVLIDFDNRARARNIVFQVVGE